LPQCPKTADEPASEHRDSWVSQIIGVQFQIIAIAVFDNSIIRHYEPPIGNFLRKHINIAQKDAIGGHGILRSRNRGIKGKATMRRDTQLALPEIGRPQKLARLAIQFEVQKLLTFQKFLQRLALTVGGRCWRT